jgi:hypothetical protein
MRKSISTIYILEKKQQTTNTHTHTHHTQTHPHNYLSLSVVKLVKNKRTLIDIGKNLILIM